MPCFVSRASLCIIWRLLLLASFQLERRARVLVSYDIHQGARHKEKPMSNLLIGHSVLICSRQTKSRGAAFARQYASQ